MINTRLFTLAALALSLAACTNDNEVMNNGPIAAVINAEHPLCIFQWLVDGR